jgi:hypothetical protein
VPATPRRTVISSARRCLSISAAARRHAGSVAGTESGGQPQDRPGSRSGPSRRQRPCGWDNAASDRGHPVRSDPHTVSTADSPYLKIANDLRGAIESGVLRPGDVLPTAKELAGRYRVAASTARRAISALVDQRLSNAGRAKRVSVVEPIADGPSSRTGCRAVDFSQVTRTDEPWRIAT